MNRKEDERLVEEYKKEFVEKLKEKYEKEIKERKSIRKVLNEKLSKMFINISIDYIKTTVLIDICIKYIEENNKREKSIEKEKKYMEALVGINYFLEKCFYAFEILREYKKLIK